MNKHFKLCLMGIVSLAFFISCQSLSVKNTSTISLVFSSSRFLEMEPCGCTYHAVGGVHREWNLLTEWRKENPNLYSIAGGTTFVPQVAGKGLQKDSIEFYKHKASFMVEALNKLQIEVLSPNSDDFFLGVSEIKKLEKRAQFPFVSANIYDGKTKLPLFKTFARIGQTNPPIYVTGLADIDLYRSKEIAVVSAAEALKKTLNEIPEGKRIIILISSLEESKREALLKQFPEINLVLGTAEKNTRTLSTRQMSQKTLYLSPDTRGKILGKLDMKISAEFSGFYNEDISIEETSYRAIIGSRLRAADEAFKTAVGKKAKKNYLTDKTNLTKQLTLHPELTENLEAGQVEYSYEFKEIDYSLDEPQNELNKLVEDYKEANRKIALEDE